VFKAKAKQDHGAYLTGITEEAESDFLSNRMGSVFKAINRLQLLPFTRLTTLLATLRTKF